MECYKKKSCRGLYTWIIMLIVFFVEFEALMSSDEMPVSRWIFSSADPQSFFPLVLESHQVFNRLQ